MCDADLIVFRTWPHPRCDRLALAPEGAYSRSAWLPTVGPTAWLLWGSVVAELDHAAEIALDADELARSLGVNAGRHGRTIPRTLNRLCQFRLFDHHSDGVYRVRMNAPPVSRASLRRLPLEVQHLQAELFGDN
jgi:hypothetical protein